MYDFWYSIYIIGHDTKGSITDAANGAGNANPPIAPNSTS